VITELTSEAVDRLGEVVPSLGMHGNDDRLPQRPCRLDGGAGVEGEVAVAEPPDVGGAGEQDGDVDRADAFDDLGDERAVGIVAGDVDDRLALGAQDEARHRAGKLLGAGRTVESGDGDDLDTADGVALPRREAVDAPDARGRRGRGEHGCGARQERATRGIQVVGMLVV